MPFRMASLTVVSTALIRCEAVSVVLALQYPDDGSGSLRRAAPWRTLSPFYHRSREERSMMLPQKDQWIRDVHIDSGIPTRRKLLQGMGLLAATPVVVALPSAAESATTTNNGDDGEFRFGVSNAVVSSLVYEKLLGQGTYKMVYQVAATPCVNNNRLQQPRYALAVERLRSKTTTKDALRGIQIVQELSRRLESEEARFVEGIEAWWFQPTPPASFAVQQPVFVSSSLKERVQPTQAPKPKPGSSVWLVALKPLYDMDLKAFAQRVPLQYSTTGATAAISTTNPVVVAGIALTQASALQLALDLCHAGSILHATGLVHRDIKPKNIMLHQGRPVVIDFEFAMFVNIKDDDHPSRACIVQPGQIKGDVRYVLAPDVTAYQGCQEGDVYAMGKALWEVLFGVTTTKSDALSARQAITAEEATRQNESFRRVLWDDSNATTSYCRFPLSVAARELLLTLIRGMCRSEMPLSFAEAESALKNSEVLSGNTT